MFLLLATALLACLSANPLCLNRDRSLAKKGAYNPAFVFSVELGGKCEMRDFAQGPIIGKGHYGIVKQAVHRPTGTVVALKYLEGINPSRFADRRNEECNQHSAESPLLVKHYCTMIHDDQVVFVMDYLEGMSFREYFQKGGKLTESQMQYYAAQMVMALEVLHQRSIIFGSLTSANVMLLKDGSMKIIDFGATILVGEGEQLEAKPTFVSYKARPHRWRNYAHDYYSLGVLLFELAYANKTGKWLDPKALRKIKCQKTLDLKICDLISRLYTEEYDKIWGSTKRTRDLLKKHPWFADIDWSWVDAYAKGNVELEPTTSYQEMSYHQQQYAPEPYYDDYTREYRRDNRQDQQYYDYSQDDQVDDYYDDSYDYNHYFY